MPRSVTQELYRWLCITLLLIVNLVGVAALVGTTTLMGVAALVTPLLHTSTNAAGDGLPDDPNIQYIGRWDTSSSIVATSYWGGAYFQTDFTGTRVQIQLAATVNISVSIDGGAETPYLNVSGIVNLTPLPLSAETHSLRVTAQGYNDVIKFRGLRLDPGATTVEPGISSKLIEFVGDSITAGYKDSDVALSDYAWLTGEQLHVKHTQIAYPGICLVDNVQCTSPHAIGMSRQFFRLQNVNYPDSPNWDFSRYQASVVVINLGTNDYKHGISAATFQSSYISFLQQIHIVYPHALIFALRTFGGFMAAQTQAAVSAMNAAGDNNVHYIDTAGWLDHADFVSDGLHPNDAGQAKVARLLAPILAPYLGVNSMITYKQVDQNS